MLSKLREYIQNSELRIVNESLRIRLSPELAKKYDAGDYDNAIKIHAGYISEINALGIKYPDQANPIFYIYVVPNENCVELLGYLGGCPVPSFDLDGFNYAYGLSQNLLKRPEDKENIAFRENDIHELSHPVHSQFFDKNRILSEGFAELLPLYTMYLEEEFDEHREVIKNMKPEDIITPQKLLEDEYNEKFGDNMWVPNKSCSFNKAYISSYLFVRGYVTKVAEKFDLDRIGSMQKFLEIVRASSCSYKCLIFDLADAIGMSHDEVLKTKTLQIFAQEEIRKIDNHARPLTAYFDFGRDITPNL